MVAGVTSPHLTLHTVQKGKSKLKLFGLKHQFPPQKSPSAVPFFGVSNQEVASESMASRVRGKQLCPFQQKKTGSNKAYWKVTGR